MAVVTLHQDTDMSPSTPRPAPFVRLLLMGLVVSAAFALTACSTPALIEIEPVTTRLEVSPDPARFGDPIVVRVHGLEPGQRAMIRATRLRGASTDEVNRSEAWFVADAEGGIDLAADAPQDARWTGADIDGLFWSMRRTAAPAPAGLDDEETRIDVLDGNGAILAVEDLALKSTLQPLVETSLGDAFPGAFVLRPPGDEPLPAIILLGGSEGGDSGARAMAPMWADRGYAAVGYPYYSPAWGDQPQAVPGLPRAFANLQVDRLADVRDALIERGDIQPDRIGLLGVSKGAEFVLIASSRIDGFAAVAAIVPSDVVWEGWGTGGDEPVSGFGWNGEPLPFVPYLDIGRAFAPEDSGNRVEMRVPHAEGRQANPGRVEPARIRVEDIEEPVFLLGGGRDAVWPSAEMAARIAATRAEAGRVTETLIFENAGHGLSGPPNRPTRTENVLARQAGWPAQIAFFERYLKDAD